MNKKSKAIKPRFLTGWGGKIWTREWGSQSPLPYRLATPQSLDIDMVGSISSGAFEGIRTPDPRLRRAMLYPAELQTQIGAGDGNRTHVTSLEG